MEEYFLQKCVTSDSGCTTQKEISTWTTNHRCEFVLVQENHQAHGASRAVLASILGMDSPSIVPEQLTSSSKLLHRDYSADASLLQLSFGIDGGGSTPQSLIKSIGNELQKIIESTIANTTASSRPVLVVFDSLNVLLQQHSLQQVLRFIKELRRIPLVGSVIMRYNASVESPATSQVLAVDTTVVVQVETPSSLNAYPILAKERRREIPKGMHGFVMLLRQKKNGRSTESVDYFQIHNDGQMHYFTATEAAQQAEKVALQQQTKEEKRTDDGAAQNHQTVQTQRSNQASLPVRQEDVSFNLTISDDEQRAKSQVQLPYMHQGSSAANTSGGGASSSTLFFIDEDDPDWDDDDLDDDLDI